MALQERIRDQWQRIRAGLGDATPSINSMEALYGAELRDLHAGELHVGALADEVWVTIGNEPLAQRVSEYAAETRSRTAEVESLLAQIGASIRERPNEAMHALVHKASDMAESCGNHVRDVALVASLQRIIHCLSADYDSLATHAAALGRSEEADRFAQYAASNKEAEDALSALAKDALHVS
jgi:ferritin-like metal-binding protein YciE